MKISVKRIKGKRASVMLKLAWDDESLPADKQRQMWEGIGMTLAAVMTPEEAKDLLSQMERAKHADPS